MKLVANAFVQDDPKAAYEDAVQRLDNLASMLQTALPRRMLDAQVPEQDLPFTSNTRREDFEAAVERSREYIRAGDIIQVVLSQRFEVDGQDDPLQVYRALRAVNPSPYMFCLELGDIALAGSSPEVHVRQEEGQVDIRPIAGTRKRGANEEEDQALEADLLADPKERAEHVMLVDLARNDIGRVCSWGSVEVSEFMIIERYSHVMHIVSNVRGQLSPEHTSYDLMRATFPAGTLSGAPKIRAMEIIAELEPDRRGPYGGAVGYFGFDGNLDCCITIRTCFFAGNKTYVQAGAGLVADSVPAAEFEETVNKAKGMMKALSLARGHQHGETP
jgi:anthranilate synthase component 1